MRVSIPELIPAVSRNPTVHVPRSQTNIGICVGMYENEQGYKYLVLDTNATTHVIVSPKKNENLYYSRFPRAHNQFIRDSTSMFELVGLVFVHLLTFKLTRFFAKVANTRFHQLFHALLWSLVTQLLSICFIHHHSC